VRAAGWPYQITRLTKGHGHHQPLHHGQVNPVSALISQIGRNAHHGHDQLTHQIGALQGLGTPITQTPTHWAGSFCTDSRVPPLAVDVAMLDSAISEPPAADAAPAERLVSNKTDRLAIAKIRANCRMFPHSQDGIPRQHSTLTAQYYVVSKNPIRAISESR
jgi:hypothetical protein